jgi:hypothetical protein
MARQQIGGEAAAARRGCAGERGVVVDGGGATRMVRRWQEVRRRLRVEDKQERKKIEPLRLYKD